ncbi:MULTISPECIES: hypothetical protein [unclassified Kocuria]|uniref:hypothetical protein n=1 Tax=unclassified Kocuria TaxID=2649579 RepID=UPI000FAE820B|nr:MULTISPECIES: hypothetical protein [unclassified Kocuria]RUP84663.1 hypothetical protein D8M39_03280 [Kocuria sp. HSID17590]RUQ13471.1 hypothetical protein D8M38_00290 [Kocuria sp. HSID17582]
MAATAVVLLAMTLFTGSTPATVVLVVLLGLFGVSANSVLIHLPVRCAAPGSARRLKPRNLPYRTTFRNVRGQSAGVTADSQERCR